MNPEFMTLVARSTSMQRMVRSMNSRSLGMQGFRVLAVGAVLALSASGAQAGLLDILFGQRPAPQPSYSMEPGLEVTVRPHRAKRRSAVTRKRPQAPLIEPTRANVSQTPMDIDGDQDWFLRDVTLRRGDIIVRENGALVYEGARHNSRLKDFVALSDTRLLSKRAKAKIKQLVAVPREDLVEFVFHRAVKPTVIEANGGVTPPTLDTTGSIVADQVGDSPKRR